MTTRTSLLSAALAIATFAALPALAQSTTPATPAPAAALESGKAPASDAHKGKTALETKDKSAQIKKQHEQVAQHPGKAAKPDASVKSDAVTPDTGSK